MEGWATAYTTGSRMSSAGCCDMSAGFDLEQALGHA